MRRRIRQQLQRGDTIVEVLIAIAVVSSVLAGAFTVTQKSTKAVRDSQERAEMLQILQGQVELVRAIALTATDDTSGIYSGGSDFCINPTSHTEIAATDPHCNGISGLYDVSIHYSAAPVNTFTFNGQWDRLGGGTNTMQLVYRIDPGATP